MPSASEGRSGPDEAARRGPTLRVEDLRVDAQEGRRLLHVPRLDVAAGEFVCVAGASGAGKSTLLFALAGLLERASGLASWDGTNLLAMSERARVAFRGERIGLVFQDFLLFDELGALDNAAMGGRWRADGERRGIEDRARELLTRFGLDPDERSAVERRSGGERQRIAVARALAIDPGVLLADEPTASLDRAAADRLVETLRDVAATRRCTLIAVSHDPAMHAAADRLVTLADGTLAR